MPPDFFDTGDRLPELVEKMNSERIAARGGFPDGESDGVTTLFKNPSTAAWVSGDPTKDDGGVQLWPSLAAPYAIIDLQVVDQDLIIWNQAEPTSPGDVIVPVWRYSYFELLPTTARTVTLPDATNVTAKKPLIFVNNGSAPVTFQRQQFPAGNTDKVAYVNEDVDFELLPGELIVLAGVPEVAGVWRVLHEQRDPVHSIDDGDSPFSMKWWHRTLLVDSSSGDVTVNLPPAVDGAQYRYTVVKIAAANTVTVQPPSGTVNGAASVSLSSQWERGTYKGDGTNYVQVG